LLAHFLPGQVPGLVAAAHGSGKNGVARHGHMGRVVGPVANNISDAFLGVARGVAMGDAQAAEVDEIVGRLRFCTGTVLELVWR